ncbi:MAG: site-specific tyrosine recombinase/integron integrase [Promethearchaeota archaeon]
MQLSELIPDFLSAKEIEEGFSPNTIQAYNYDLSNFQNYIGDLQIQKIQMFQIRRFLKSLHNRGYTKRSLARKIATLKSFFKFCIENEILEKNPMRSIKSPKIRPEETLPKYLSLIEIQNLLNSIHQLKNTSTIWRNRLEITIRLMYASMARVSEICALHIQDVDLENNSIKVHGKGNKERMIPIDFETSLILADHIENRKLETPDLNAFLFSNIRNKPLQPRSVQRDIQKLKDILEYPKDKKLTPHIFRHTGATHLRQNGMDLSELQDLLGHSNPNTTRIYAKNDLTRLKASYSQFHPLAKISKEHSD